MKKKTVQFFSVGEGSRFFVVSFLHLSAQICLYQTPGRRPSRITGRAVNTVTRLHGEVVGFVDRCCGALVSRRFELNIWLSFSQANVGPSSGQDIFLLRLLFESLEFFATVCAHSEW